MEEPKDPTKPNRRYYKVRKVGFGLSVTIPREFARAQGIQEGKYLRVTWDEHELKVSLVKE